MYDAEKLREAISAVIPATGTGGLDEDYRNISFNGDHVIATNDRICIAHPFETDFKITVPAKEFQQLLPSSGGVEVKEKNGKVIIQFGKTKSSLSLSAEATAADLFESLNTKEAKWKKIPEGLMEGLKICRFSASREMSEPYLTCVYAEGSRIVASDEVRISEYKSEKKITKTPWLIPAKSVDELAKLEIRSFSATKAWFYFKGADNKIFCARRVTEQYPDVSDFFKFKEIDKVKMPVDKMVEAIKYVSTMASAKDDGYKRISVEFIGKKIILEGSNDLGTATKEVIAKRNTNNRFKIVVNPEFFIELVKLSDTIKVGKDRILVESDNFKHLVALFVD